MPRKNKFEIGMIAFLLILFAVLFVLALMSLREDVEIDERGIWDSSINEAEDFSLMPNRLSNEFCPFSFGEDVDNDMIQDICDNCPLHYNPEQSDRDKDGYGDACDLTYDKDDSKVNISCNKDSDCTGGGLIGGLFCSDNNVARKFEILTCKNPGKENSYCSSRVEDRVIEICERGETCDSGECVREECTPKREVCDGRDNDCDGIIDEGNVCRQKRAQCDDGIDNDGDRRIDYPADRECSSRLDNSESS